MPDVQGASKKDCLKECSIILQYNVAKYFTGLTQTDDRGTFSTYIYIYG